MQQHYNYSILLMEGMGCIKQFHPVSLFAGLWKKCMGSWAAANTYIKVFHPWDISSVIPHIEKWSDWVISGVGDVQVTPWQ